MKTSSSKFATGDWFHLFGHGSRETQCRIVIDLEKSLLVAAQEWTGLKFVDIYGERFNDLTQSVIDVNEAAVDPESHCLMYVDVLPKWVHMTTYSIVSSNLTSRLFAWEGARETQKKYLGNRQVIGEVIAANDAAAMATWMAGVQLKLETGNAIQTC